MGTKNKWDAASYIEGCKKIHGDRYDYSNTVYVRNTIKVEIICRKHGSFWQRPSAHLSGDRCKECAHDDKKDKTIHKFIEKANKVHHNRYDYSIARETYDEGKVIIICKEHGGFRQALTAHLKGFGCHICNNKAYDIKSFIFKATTIHGSKYDYSKTEYTNSHTKLAIVCREHGEFWQFPCDHLNNKAGCPKCAGTLVFCTKSFIEQANKVHRGAYDYSKVEYVRTNKKVEIICPKHGTFWQTPNSHLGGSKCEMCYRRFATQEEFIEEANVIHNGRYDYSLVQFTTCNKKIEIICREHGVFQQTPANHLQPNDCPKCTKRISRAETEWLNYLGIENRQVKLVGGRKNRLIVDGFDPITNTAYEFYGDFWHGNPKIFDPNAVNHSVKKTFSELYEKTLQREQRIKSLGYNLITIWEDDWIKKRTSVI
jgi:hypothetical protein